jgi:hypothetical protein
MTSQYYLARSKSRTCAANAKPDVLKQHALIGFMLTCIGLLLIHNESFAKQYPIQPLWQTQPPGQWSFRPPTQRQTWIPQQSQVSPFPYGSSWQNQQQPRYSPQSYYGRQSDAPYLEVTFTKKDLYVQQSTLLKLSIISQNNLLTASAHIPQTDNLLLNKLEGPITYSHRKKGKQVIINDFYYEVTALKEGHFVLPNITLSGEEQARGYRRDNKPFELRIPNNLTMDVLAANPSSRPWLPLEQLSLTARLPKDLKPEAGKPLALAIELSAIGASGNRLPGIGKQLSSDAFRIYRDNSYVETRLDQKRRKIIGRRVETYTLVPQFGGDLKLPELSVNWWSTRMNMPQRASVPIHPIAVSGTQRSSDIFNFEFEGSLFPGGSPSAFWIPLAMSFGIIFGYWMAIGLSHYRKGGKGRSPLQPLVIALQLPMRHMAPAFTPLKNKLRTTSAILNPVKGWHRWRRRLVATLPLSVRFWFCVRFVDEENDPEVWGYTLRFLANKHLGLAPNVPFSVIGKQITEFHPKAKPEKIHALIHELEHAIYGHITIDFNQWKEAFKREIRPTLRFWPDKKRGINRSHKAQLPNLNPNPLA